MGKKKRTEKKTSLIDIIPYIFIVAVVPLIVYLRLYKLDPVEVANWKGMDEYADLLSYWKSRWFIIASAAGLCLFILRNIQGRVRIRREMGLYVPAAVYIVFIILSTVTSGYISVALSGFVARYEGIFVLLFYIVNMLILSNLINEERQIRIIFGALLVSASIICLIGLSQLAGRDFLQTGFGKSLILPAKYIRSELEFKFGTMVYGTLPNPNYIGSYVTLVFPIAVASIFLVKKKGLRIAAAVLSALLLVNLIGSQSTAGLVGLGAAILVAVIYFRKYIFRNKIIVVLSLAVVLAGLGFVGSRVIPKINAAGTQGYYLEDITFENNIAKITSATETLIVRYDDPAIAFYDTNQNKLQINLTDGNDARVITFTDPAYKNYRLTLLGDILKIQNRGAEFVLRFHDGAIRFVGSNGDEPNQIARPEAIDVRGFEKTGSARIYIWSRAVPLLKNALLVGYGPDTFVIKFPQNDYIGKVNAYGTSNMIVDKPHNLYLQIAVNTGVLSLLAFLAMIIVYGISSVKLYFIQSDRSVPALFGAAIFIGICSYLVTSLFNDSVIAVAPIFWVLLGLGFACNNMSARDLNRKKEMPASQEVRQDPGGRKHNPVRPKH
jgi:O-antigen ligase